MLHFQLKQTSPAEILLRSKDRKRQKISERNRGYYRHNKGKTVLNDDSGEASKWAVYKRGQRERKSKLQLKLTDTQKKKIYREKRKLQQQNSQEIENIYVFPNRMSKLRAKRKLEAALPRTPERRSAVLMSVFEGTHVRRCLDFETSVLRDLKETVTELKSKRSDDARAALNVITASIAGGNVTASRSSSTLAKSLGISRRRIAGKLQQFAHLTVSHQCQKAYTYQWLKLKTV